MSPTPPKHLILSWYIACVLQIAEIAIMGAALWRFW